MKVGEFIGALYKKKLDTGEEKWFLHEGKITKIVQNSKGTKVYSSAFYPLDIEEIEDNTECVEENENFILTREVVLLTDKIRSKYERWIEWANNNLDKVEFVFSAEDK